MREKARSDQVQRDLERRKARQPWLIALLAALSIGLVGALALGHMTRQAQAMALQEARNATLISEFLRRDVLQSADTSRLGNDKPRTMLEVLSRASDLAAQRFADAPLVEAAVRRQLGEINLRLSLVFSAEKEFKRALSLLGEGAASSSMNHERWMSQLGLAQAMTNNDRATEALEQLKQTQAAAGAALEELGTELAYVAARTQAEVMLNLKRYTQAHTAAISLVQAADQWPQANPDDRWVARQILAETLLLSERPEEAQSVLQALGQDFSAAPTVAALTQARLHYIKGRLLSANSQIPQAINEQQKALVLALQAAGPQAHMTGRIYFELANALSTSGDGKGSRVALEGAHVAFTASFGEDSPTTKSVESNLGLLQVLAGESTQGLPSSTPTPLSA